ncbi:hypothetical protein K0504_03885 [Neiella marina]|uniref:Uncharacterized protein n=1 Tax=Neiella holothuriorum TaxID=2870530 RepID=A0ABS7ECV1_9GAMM|nr:hypothetical protein [Neiella holothuriorum]MBW8190167.1 hypothetical protein [Neiella holothuriorum]
MKYFVSSTILAFGVLLLSLNSVCHAMTDDYLDYQSLSSTANSSTELPTGQQAYDEFDANQQYDFLSLTRARQAVVQTYNSFYQSLVNYSHKIEILPAATDGFYDTQAESYRYFSMPLVALPSDNVRFELFTQAYDPLFYALSHRSQDDPLQQYMPYADIEFTEAKMAFGLGATMALDERTRLRSVYTTGTIPGLGDANLGLQLQFDF